MKRPIVTHPKFKTIIEDAWVRDGEKQIIGDGSIADAICHEHLTGQATKGRFHAQKGKQLITQLENWLRGKKSKYPELETDKRIARAVIEDLRRATQGKCADG